MSPPPTAVQHPRVQRAAPGARPVSRLPLRVPLSRPPRRNPTGRPTRTTVGFSLAVHLLLALVLALLPVRDRAGAAPEGQPEGAPGTGGAYVDYMDLGDWPRGSTLPAGLPVSAPADAPLAASVDAGETAQRPDSARTAPAVAPPFPRGGGAPAAGRGGAGAQPGAGAGQPGVAGGTPGGAAGGAARGAGARLGPEFGDSRLVVRPQAVPERELTDLERYLVHFNQRLKALNDSLQGEADRERRLREWVWRDGQGREWGIRDGKIVVDGKEIPIPLPTPQGDRDHEDAARTRARQREEIDRQADRIQRDGHLQDRNRAIRERRERERSGGAP